MKSLSNAPEPRSRTGEPPGQCEAARLLFAGRGIRPMHRSDRNRNSGIDSRYAWTHPPAKTPRSGICCRTTRRPSTHLSRALRVSPIVAQLLLNRNMAEPAQAETFLTCPLTGLHEPELLPGVTPRVERILLAIAAQKENLRLRRLRRRRRHRHRHPADLPARCSAPSVEFHVPHRLEEGYGLNSETLQKLAASRACNVVVTVDCGIASLAEADEARRLGLELIVTDHHEPKATLPARRRPGPSAPARARLAYPFGGLSGAGVAFKLAWALCRSVRQRQGDAAAARVPARRHRSWPRWAPSPTWCRCSTRTASSSATAWPACAPSRCSACKRCCDCAKLDTKANARRRRHRLRAGPAHQRRRPARHRPAGRRAADDAVAAAGRRAGRLPRTAEPRTPAHRTPHLAAKPATMAANYAARAGLGAGQRRLASGPARHRRQPARRSVRPAGPDDRPARGPAARPGLRPLGPRLQAARGLAGMHRRPRQPRRPRRRRGLPHSARRDRRLPRALLPVVAAPVRRRAARRIA